MSLLKRILTRAMRREISQIDALYQRHAGEECYLIGAGISLKWMDLRAFTDRVAILGNMAVYHKDVGALQALYCTVTQPFFFYPFFPYRRDGKTEWIREPLHAEYARTIRQHPKIRFFINFSNYPVARFPNAVYVSRWYAPPFEQRNPFRHRTDANEGTFKFQIALAIYMGFSKAYLIGHDYTHSPPQNFHFFEKGRGLTLPDGDFNGEFLSYAKQYIDLTTVTLGADSRAMRAITYTELTGRQPEFRENVELIESRKLESLAGWSGYSVL